MIITWEPSWYELDQTVIVGDKDFFYLEKGGKSFANGLASNEDKEFLGEITRISHYELGELLGILTIGLSYKLFFKDGNYIQVDAEENIGMIEYPDNCKVSNWLFNVDVNILEITGYSSLQRINIVKKTEGIKLGKERKERYKRLLNIDYL